MNLRVSPNLKLLISIILEGLVNGKYKYKHTKSLLKFHDKADGGKEVHFSDAIYHEGVRKNIFHVKKHGKVLLTRSFKKELGIIGSDKKTVKKKVRKNKKSKKEIFYQRRVVWNKNLLHI